MTTASETTAESSARGERLSRKKIVVAALASIDRYGVPGLTMRGLAVSLRVEAMSLYRYVKGREDLLEAVAGELLTGVSNRLHNAPGHWQTFLRSVAYEVRRIAVDHPNGFPLVATRHPAAPWLRPPLRNIELVDMFLTDLLDRGFTDRRAVSVYRAFSSFLLGQLLSEAATRETGTTIERQPPMTERPPLRADSENVDPAMPSPVSRLRNLLSENHSQTEFETALESLLDRLEPPQ